MKRDLMTAYFAGLIDGEGHISMKSKGALRPKVAAIEVKMTCEKTVRAIKQHFGSGNIRYVPAQNSRWQPQWKWYATCLAARNIIEQLLPYLITKRDVAEQVCKTVTEKRGGG